MQFRANHFAVSADKLEVIELAGTLEFEAILFGNGREIARQAGTMPTSAIVDLARQIRESG